MPWGRNTVREAAASKLGPCLCIAHRLDSLGCVLTPPGLHPAAEEQFEELCFEYGIELDDVVSAAARRQPPACRPLPLPLPSGVAPSS